MAPAKKKDACNPVAVARDTVAGEALRRFSTCAGVNSL